MAYTRTKFDKVRLHGGGIFIGYIIIDLVNKGLWVPAALAGLLMGVFMRFEGSLLNASKTPPNVSKK